MAGPQALRSKPNYPFLIPLKWDNRALEAALKGITDDPAYKEMFLKAYGRGPNYDDLARAIAAFERTLVFLDSPFDRFLGGDQQAISVDAKKGWALFNGKGRCSPMASARIVGGPHGTAGYAGVQSLAAHGVYNANMELL